MQDHERTAPPHRPTVPIGTPTAMDVRREQEQRAIDIALRQQCIQQAVNAAAGKANWTVEDVAILAERFYLFATNK